MKIQITQNDYGNYNFSRDEKSTVFSMVIKDENGVVKVGEIPCRLQYSSDTDETYDFENATDNLEWVFEKCFNYSKNTWGSTDYTAQCLAFAKIYKENFETIKQNYLSSEEKRISDKIESLKKELANLSFEESDFSYPLKKRIESIEKHIASSEEEISQYVEGSEKKQKCLDQINRLEEEKKKYEDLITV